MSVKNLIIVGSFRSGTSALVEILNKCKEVLITDESWYFSNTKEGTSEFEAKVLRLLNNKLLPEERPILTKDKVANLNNVLKKTSDKTSFKDLLLQHNPNIKLFGDKFPEYIFNLEQINIDHKPKVIMCIRDPRDVIGSQILNYQRLMKQFNSVHQHWWAKATIQECIEMTPSWFDFVSEWKRVKEHKLTYYELNYNALVKNPAMESTRLSIFLNVCPVTLYKSFCRTFRPTNHLKWKQVCPDIDKQLPDSWKNLMREYGFII